jgi:hypothetical protein
MSEPISEPRKPRSSGRIGVALIAALLLFCATAIALWAFTALTFAYAIMAASPVVIVVACCVVAIDAFGEIVAAIFEAIGAAIAGILAAIAAVFTAFGG